MGLGLESGPSVINYIFIRTYKTQHGGFMKEFKSNEEFFSFFLELTDRIEKHGNPAAALALREGFSCLNGLTDGSAMLMEAIERVIAGNKGKLPPAEMSDLKDMLKVVKKTVYRR